MNKRCMKIDKEWLREQYSDKKRTMRDIAHEVGCCRETISRVLKRYGIKTRFGTRGRVGSLHCGWKGGVRRTPKGYILIWAPDHPNSKNNCVPEHRLVMEENLGRYLGRGDVVHHINGIKDDNRIENLELYTQKTHTSMHVNRAKELIKKGEEAESCGPIIDRMIDKLDGVLNGLERL